MRPPPNVTNMTNEKPLPPPPFTPEPPKLNEGEDNPTLVTAEELEKILDDTLIKEHRYNPYLLKWLMSFLTCRSNRQACEAAGITTDSGDRIKRKRDVQEAIRRINKIGILKYGYDAEEIIQRVKEIVDFDPADLERKDGSYHNRISDIKPEARRAIKSFKVKNLFETDPNGMKRIVGEIIDVQFYDKLKGAEMLGNEKDLFKQKVSVEHSVSGNMADILLEARRRGEVASREVKEIAYKEVKDDNTK